MDGANGIQKFLRLTLPGLSPIMFYTIVVNIIQAFQSFGQVKILTQGGPGAVSYTHLDVYKRQGLRRIVPGSAVLCKALYCGKCAAQLLYSPPQCGFRCHPPHKISGAAGAGGRARYHVPSYKGLF